MSNKFETSKADGVHFTLSKLIGEWEGNTSTWFEPDTIADQSPVKGVMRSIMDGRFIMHEYSGSFGGQALSGIAIYGYNLTLGKIQCAWIDSFHNGTAIMFSEGKRNETNLSMLGGYVYISPEEEQHWGWRTEIDIVTDNELKITAYNISPAGVEVKATETVYKRIGEL